MKSDLIEMVEYSFGSVWALELLLLLYRDRDRAWAHADLVRELRSSDVVVRDSMRRLMASGLIVVEGDAARYRPATQEQDDLVEQLAAEYSAKPATIRRMIVQGATDKLRSFSDAFKLKPG
jgi:predicted MarR family transcription regulator